MWAIRPHHALIRCHIGRGCKPTVAQCCEGLAVNANCRNFREGSCLFRGRVIGLAQRGSEK